MRIVNVMVSKILGGLEQAFIDYNSALLSCKHEVLAVVDNKSKVLSSLEECSGLQRLKVSFNRYNIFLIPYLYFKLKSFSPDLIITHSKKTIPILKIVAGLLKIKIIGVSHNPKFKLVNKCDGIFSITQYQKDIFIQKGFPAEKIFVIPNMIVEQRPYRPLPSFQNPPVIGVIGRFDPMKDFSCFIGALSILKEKNIPFKAIIAGGAQKNYPQEYENILAKIKMLGLEEDIELPGWIKNKDDFYGRLDIFVLPSKYEPFGIVLLEAMLRSLPVVSSLAEGPSEIYKNAPKAAFTFPISDEKALAACLEKALANWSNTAEVAKNGYELCRNNYSLAAISKVLDKAVTSFGA